MEKIKKIPINEFDRAAGAQERESTVEWNGLEIRVRRRISYEEYAAASVAVTNACFNTEGEYVPEAKEVSLRLIVLALYTNLSIPLNIDKRYEMACFSGVYDAVLSAVDGRQVAQIDNAVNERIHIRTQAAVDAVIRQANAVAEAVQNMGDKFEAQFAAILEGVTPEDMNRVIRGIADGEVDEEKVVEAYRKPLIRTVPAGVVDEDGE